MCAQIEDGNPAYLVGKTGCELAREVVLEIAGTELPQEDVMYMDKSPEYWLGWSLAYYVWLRNCKFRYVLKAISAEEMLCMYDTLHEADIEKYVEAIDKNISGFYTCTALV